MTTNGTQLNGVYPMRVVSRLTGLTADTIRVWERRYKAVDPERTGGNKRRYSDEQVRRLVLLRRATELGHSIGQVAKLADEDLKRIIGDLGNDTERPASLYESIVEDYLDAICAYDVQEAESILSRTAAIIPPMELTLEVIVPLMRRIGEAWSSRELGISHEHIISGQLRSLLGTLMRQTEPNAGAARVIVATPPAHLHEFGAIIGAFIAASRGLEPIYLGADMPFEEIEQAATHSGAGLVLLSIARDPRPGENEELLAGLLGLGKRHETWVGIPRDHELVGSANGLRLLHEYEDLDRALVARSSPSPQPVAHG